jgi:hypothetical protein
MKTNANLDRRSFLLAGGTLALGTMGFTTDPSVSLNEDEINLIGPKSGFTPQMGTLVSMMTWMRHVIQFPVKGLTVEQLDYVHDEKSNSIGSMLFHLAATERYYQLHTFEDRKWGDFPETDKKKFDIAMNLGEEARKTIKGNNLEFYLGMLKEVRENTLKEFKKRDDAWLMKVDNDFWSSPTNNFCKWFHVCEHESNHNGQMKWIKSRIPGIKSDDN